MKAKLGSIVDNAEIDHLTDLAHATAVRVEEELRRAQQSRLDIRVVINEIRKGQRDINSTIRALASDNRALDIAMLLRELADLKDVDVSRVMFREEAGPTAVLCRHLKVSSEAFYAIAKLRCKRLKHHMIQAKEELALYEKLNEADANRAIRFLKVRNSVGNTG